MAVDMSRRLGWIDQELVDRTRDLLLIANLPVAPPQVCLTIVLLEVAAELEQPGTYSVTLRWNSMITCSQHKSVKRGFAWTDTVWTRCNVGIDQYADVRR